jgi:hypothetical protein
MESPQQTISTVMTNYRNFQGNFNLDKSGYEPDALPLSYRPERMAPRVGFEPTTYRLTAGCSTVELSRNIGKCYYTIVFNCSQDI